MGKPFIQARRPSFRVGSATGHRVRMVCCPEERSLDLSWCGVPHARSICCASTGMIASEDTASRRKPKKRGTSSSEASFLLPVQDEPWRGRRKRTRQVISVSSASSRTLIHGSSKKKMVFSLQGRGLECMLLVVEGRSVWHSLERG